jgi:hypothetical protein
VLGATRYAAAGAHGPVDQRLVRGGRAQHHLRVVNHLPLSSMRSGNAAVCAAGREGNYIWSASRMDISGGEEENIPRPFGHRKRRARSRSEYRNAESHERFEFDAQPRPRYGANTGAGTIVSTPGTLRRLGARCKNKWDKTATPASRAKGREARASRERASPSASRTVHEAHGPGR